jgi:thiol-disulfide isomerase/thioredoxin
MLALALLLAPVTAPAYDIGDPVADIQLTDLDGLDVALSDHAGEIVVLNFFTTWCPGCNEEAAVLEQQIWQVYREDGVTVIAIDIMEPAGLVRGWTLANEITYHVWLAPDWSVLDPFTDTPALPYNTVLDRDHTLRYAQIGFDRDAIIETVETILEEDAMPVSAATWSNVKRHFAE